MEPLWFGRRLWVLLGEEAKPGKAQCLVQQCPASGLETLLREARGPRSASEEAGGDIMCPVEHHMCPSSGKPSTRAEPLGPDVEGKQAALLFFTRQARKGPTCSFSSQEALRSPWLS